MPYSKSFDSSAFAQSLSLMGSTQQLAARSLINLIEMISSNSHQYVQENQAFAKEAFELVQKAATVSSPDDIGAIQKSWTDTCMKYGQNQTQTTMNFIQQCGAQALSVAAESEPVLKPKPKPRKAPLKDVK